MSVEIERTNDELLDAYILDVERAEMGDPPQRGAAYAAASKRYKQSVVFKVLLEASREKGIDLTYLLAERFVIACLGRGVEREAVLDWFATAGRTASSKSADHDRLGELVHIYKPTVDYRIGEALVKMEWVRSVAEKQRKLARKLSKRKEREQRLTADRLKQPGAKKRKKNQS